ncbi:helix-turn-helix transcriptional regulator [Brevibacterium casei]|uniref:Helix-turn-helix transcriptional regulator n=1 Tax=Brevibacterium casei TaxID=33889 RepID=A0A7T2WQF2_9MICO|nr:helix-turn-helix transcriptional regulator [Brevibacterium casei]
MVEGRSQSAPVRTFLSLASIRTANGATETARNREGRVRGKVRVALETCPAEVVVAVLGGTWKITVVKSMIDGPIRFGQLQRAVPGVNRKTLTRQLAELEADGVVQRTDHGESPPRVDYRLTGLGSALIPVIAEMERWGGTYAESRDDLG